jgi:hypothetical protein
MLNFYCTYWYFVFSLIDCYLIEFFVIIYNTPLIYSGMLLLSIVIVYILHLERKKYNEYPGSNSWSHHCRRHAIT